jgi:hypothetical protein
MKELEVAFGGNSFIFLLGFHRAFLSIKDTHCRISHAVKVFIIQKLQTHYSSNMFVFRKIFQYHQVPFQILFYNAQAFLSKEPSQHNIAVLFPSEECGPPSATLQSFPLATIHTVASSTIATSSEYSLFQIDTSDGSSYNFLFQI